MARTAFVALACGILGAAHAALVVTSPEAEQVVVGGSTVTVEWTGTGTNNRFEIDLYYCGSMCMGDDCGEWVTALCPYGDDGCPDNMGDYDVVMPEPMGGTSGGGYKIHVMDINNEEHADCSDEFYLLASDDAPEPEEMDGPFIDVIAPGDGDSAEAGEEYTVEFLYDDGFGSSANRFSIDLYSSEGSGECGTFMYTLCDKPSVGCKDTKGDYDIVIPEDTPAGMYRIRVGVFSDPDVYDCSGEFEVLGDGLGGPMSFRF